MTKNTPTHGKRASNGKIGRLPDTIREQLNQRLLDNHTSRDILAWFNELPAVKDILAAQFRGSRITKQNLSHWRHLGFERWQRERQNISSAKERGKYAQEFTEAAGGRFAPAAAALAASKIFEYLEALDVEKAKPEDLVRCANAAFALLKGEQNVERIKIAQERVQQNNDRLLLTRHKHERDVTAIGLRLLTDARAKEIAAAPVHHCEKIEMLGRQMFIRTWRHRPVPVPPNPNPVQPPSSPVQPSPTQSKPIQPS
jgi:hypothetical protein